jgi:hypothetical protein
MVGFGSSLRIARRSGWEGAYLDYETLKLLLSQIEAVYEEETHRQTSHEWNVLGEQETARDYREELFLESDSDEEYASLEDDVDINDNDDLSAGMGAADESGQNVDFSMGTSSRSSKPFKLSYSHEATSSDEEEDLVDVGCGAGTLSSWTPRTWDTSNITRKKPPYQQQGGNAAKRKAHRLPRLREDDDFYASAGGSGHAIGGGGVRSGIGTLPSHGTTLTNNTATQAFYMAGGSGSDSAEYLQTLGSSHTPSILNAPIRRTGESASLLPPTTPSQSNASWYTFHTSPSVRTSHNMDNTTPPHVTSADFLRDNHLLPESINLTPPLSGRMNHRGDDERNRDRVARRKRRHRLRAIRKQKERKVPRHIRVAHSKARAITERFLGLLRAETEKVMLFAQSRLGELADTAGSLRFPSIDEIDYVPHQTQGSAAYDYRLTDGGMHPSASSSEDDGPAGACPWSDSSDEEDATTANNGRASPREGSYIIPKGHLSEETLGRANPSASKSVASSAKQLKRAAKIKESKGQRNVKQHAETLSSVQRQIAHFARLRKNRPVFQRNDQILGEDMLLISAVEEADGFTAVGVELMHVLRYICVNLIAVRKICRKHDRLLMNRMLGGYYHRTRNLGHDRYAHIEDVQTLGGLLARVSGDIYEAHPALIGHMTYYKLVGVYDRKVQKLANSRTVQVISACLALALSEHEITQSRAEKLTKIQSTTSSDTPKRSGHGGTLSWVQGLKNSLFQPAVKSDDEEDDGPPSTTSTVSLTRLRFTVTSIFALREAARYKMDHYATYLSRSLISFTGQPAAGEGLDGCSRVTLDFLVSYNPDAALLFDSSVLYNGIKHGLWLGEPVSEVMVSTLAAATSPDPAFLLNGSSTLSPEELAVANAVSIVPGPKNLFLQSFLKGLLPKQLAVKGSPNISEAPLKILRLSQFSCFLYSMNYFVAHSSTNTFTRAMGAHSAYSSVIIGIPNVAAIIVAVIHVQAVASEKTAGRFPRDSTGLLRGCFLVSAIMGVLGNIAHSLAIEKECLALAICGRFLLGFSSAEILHRQLLSTCLPAYIVSESSMLVQLRAVGTVLGLIAGTIIESLPISFDALGIRVLQTSGWLMAVLWMTQLINLLLSSGLVEGRMKALGCDFSVLEGQEINGPAKASSVDYSSDSSSSVEPGTPTSVLYRSSSDVTSHDPFTIAYGSQQEEQIMSDQNTASTESTPLKTFDHGIRRRPFRQITTFFARTKKLLAFHIAIPISLAILLYTSYATEVFFTATPIVVCRYFGWNGDHAGVFLGGLALLVLPTYFVCELVARRYEERTVLKVSR